jgi:hypothetical protein
MENIKQYFKGRIEKLNKSFEINLNSNEEFYCDYNLYNYNLLGNSNIYDLIIDYLFSDKENEESIFNYLKIKVQEHKKTINDNCANKEEEREAQQRKEWYERSQYKITSSQVKKINKIFNYDKDKSNISETFNLFLTSIEKQNEVLLFIKNNTIIPEKTIKEAFDELLARLDKIKDKPIKNFSPGYRIFEWFNNTYDVPEKILNLKNN